jgi:hypothetical protein
MKLSKSSELELSSLEESSMSNVRAAAAFGAAALVFFCYLFAFTYN